MTTAQTWWLSAMCFLLVAVGIAPLLSWLQRAEFLDIPNERSSHGQPTPIGAGIVIVCVLLPCWYFIAERPVLHILIPAFVLAVVSLRDDFKRLSVLVRLAGHFTAVVLALTLEPKLAGPFEQVVPEPAAFVLTALCWVWFINLFNFMDGIDGITGVEAACIGLGITAVTVVGSLSADLAGFGLTVAAAAVGFLLWNWHPAKIFLGDVGSVPLGFLLGWLLLSLAASGAWAAALILPGYYLFDATLTLSRRALRGEQFWRGHREHIYQQSIRHGFDHAEVSGFILVGNLVLIGIAVGSISGPANMSLLAAALVVAGLAVVLWLGDADRRT